MSESITEKPSKGQFQKGKKFKRGKNGSRFLSNAKGFGKKGNFGRGTHIEEDQFTYFIGILDALRSPTNSAEDRASMSNNVMEQTKGKEIHLASNQVVSKTLEALIGFTEPEHLERFFEVFGENFRPICSDPFASHVLQKMVEIAFIRAVGDKKIKEEDVGESAPKKAKEDEVTDLKYALSTKYTKQHRTKCSEFVKRVSKFLLNNLEDFVWDACGSHLIRTCIMSLGGVHVPKVAFAKGKSLDSHTSTKPGPRQTAFKVSSEWVELMKEFSSRLEMWPQFSELPYNERSSGLLGVICIALSNVDKSAFKHFGKKLLKETFVDVDVPENQRTDKETKQNEEEDSDNNEESAEKKKTETDNGFPSVFKSESSVRLLETVISVAGPKLLTEIHSTLFLGRIADLAKGAQSNFSVQKLLNHVTDKSVFELMFDELIDHLTSYLEVGYTGVVGAISRACLRLNTKQAAFITALQSALQCTTANGADRPKLFFACLLKLKPAGALLYDKGIYVALHGSLIIQDILQYNKPIFLVNCILETPPKDLVAALLLPNGSYIADVYLTSKFIGEKSREKFIKLFEGFYMDLALGRCGSRVLEKLFDAANEIQKLRIAKELTTKENKLRGNVFGRIIFNVLRLETFRLSPDQWKASWTKTNKGEEILNKIVKKRPASEIV